MIVKAKFLVPLFPRRTDCLSAAEKIGSLFTAFYLCATRLVVMGNAGLLCHTKQELIYFAPYCILCNCTLQFHYLAKKFSFLHTVMRQALIPNLRGTFSIH